MLLKKTVLILAFILLFSFSVYSAEKPSLSAESAVLINGDTLEVIYEKNAHERHSMASTTKIMTALLAIESGKMSQVVTADNITTEGTAIGIKKGYKMTLDALVWGMLLESGNDAAKLAAEFLSDSEESFSVLMNKKAEEIGMMSTHFVTASGLDSQEHYSTAYDMAILGAKAVKNPVFREICSSKTKTVQFIEPEISMTFSNHNRLLYSCEGVFGIKTGFTKKSGRCLVSSCVRNGVTLICVTLNAGDDWNDHIKLYDYGFDCINYSKVVFRLPEEVKVYGAEKLALGINCEDYNSVVAFCGKEEQLTQKVYLPSFLYAPIKAGEVIGRVELYKDSTLIYSRDILATQSINAIKPTQRKGFFIKIKDKLLDIFH